MNCIGRPVLFRNIVDTLFAVFVFLFVFLTYNESIASDFDNEGVGGGRDSGGSYASQTEISADDFAYLSGGSDESKVKSDSEKAISRDGKNYIHEFEVQGDFTRDYINAPKKLEKKKEEPKKKNQSSKIKLDLSGHIPLSDVTLNLSQKSMFPSIKASSIDHLLERQSFDHHNSVDGNYDYETEKNKKIFLLEEKVIASAMKYYPQITIATEEVRIADQKFLSSKGGFDVSISGVQDKFLSGKYEDYEYSKLSVSQPLPFLNAKVGLEYKNSYDFQFPSVFSSNWTDDEGRVVLKYSMSLMRNALFPENVTNVRLAQNRKIYAKAMKQFTEMKVVATAAKTYWKWVAYGNILQGNQEIKAIRDITYSILETQVAQGNKAEMDLQYYRLLLLEQDNKIQESSLQFVTMQNKLSLYYRNKLGKPIKPRKEELPEIIGESFVERSSKANCTPDGVCVEPSRSKKPRADMVGMKLEKKNIDIQIKKAKNDLLPSLTFFLESGKYNNHNNIYSNDWNMRVGLRFSMKLQNRKARGKLGALRAKQIMQNEKIKFLQDKILAQVTILENRLNSSIIILRNNKNKLKFAKQLFESQRFRLQVQDLDRYDLLTAEYYYYNAKIEYIKAQLQYKLALIDHSFATAQIVDVINAINDNENKAKVKARAGSK